MRKSDPLSVDMIRVYLHLLKSLKVNSIQSAVSYYDIKSFKTILQYSILCV